MYTPTFSVARTKARILVRRPFKFIRNVSHSDIIRFIVPVFDCTKHLRGNISKRFSPEDVITQRAAVDPSWNRELPEGAFVCMHSTVTVYTNARTKAKSLSFNLLAVEILALPKFG